MKKLFFVLFCSSFCSLWPQSRDTALPGKLMLLIKEGLGDPKGKSAPQSVIGPEGEKRKRKQNKKTPHTSVHLSESSVRWEQILPLKGKEAWDENGKEDGEGHSEIADLGLAAHLGWEAYSFTQQPSLRINQSPRVRNGSANHLTKKGQSVASKTEKGVCERTLGNFPKNMLFKI